MSSFLEKNGYILDSVTNVWSRPDFEGIPYTDGDEIENRLQAIIRDASDVETSSLELRQNITDWPSLYHLSNSRGNLLRPLEDKLKSAEVLELGAGCGAITRYLGECGAKVYAVEGSLRRASIARSRTRELSNVHVIAEQIDRLKLEKKFDVVTLVGVLEYARKFFPSDDKDPIEALLEFARKRLKPEGILIVAIENQLGLKYFAGAPEDHYGQAMYGIEDCYQDDGVVTFGKAELSQKLKNCGLAVQDWWYPFPDYKLPTVVISDELTQMQNQFDLESLIASNMLYDPQVPEITSFNLQRAWAPVTRNGLLGDLANSFLVIASQKERPSENEKTIACHFASDRRKQFAKKVLFIKDNKDLVSTQQIRLYPEASEDTELPLRQKLKDQTYILGENWERRLIKVMSSPNWDISLLKQWARTWFDALISELKLGKQLRSLGIHTQIDGKFIDAIPRNLIVQKDNTARFIDLEWEMDNPLEFGHLLFRGLYLPLSTASREPLPGTPRTNLDLFYVLVEDLGYTITAEDLESYYQTELLLQSCATGLKPIFTYSELFQKSIPIRESMASVLSVLNQKVHSLTEEVNSKRDEVDGLISANKALEHQKDMESTQLNDTIAKLNKELDTSHTKIKDIEAQASILQDHLTQRDSLIAELKNTLEAREATIHECQSQIEKLESIITDLNETLQAKEQNIADNLSQLESLESAISELEAYNQNQIEDLQEQSSIIENLKENITKKESHLTHLHARLTNFDRAYHEVLMSKSWRITKPIRLASNYLYHKPRAYARSILVRALKALWTSVPLGQDSKEAIKSYFFKTFPFVFINTSVYKRWQEHRGFASPSQGINYHPRITVILPAYKDAQLTRDCINSAMPDICKYDRARLLIVNDASPEPEMESVIGHAESVWRNKIDVIRNVTNLGFVKSVNTALDSCPEDDVILLNSDVIVPQGWLTRLLVDAYSENEIGTVTPLSNSTTICTFPEFLQDNTMFEKYTVDQVDEAFRETRLANIEAPTGVGFCMYIKRALINRIGTLDEKHFPRGYGEENDFCQRAIKEGWKNVISPNMYAYHKGGVSFGQEKQELINNALRIIDRLHPNYHADVHAFIKNDPLQKYRVFRLINFLSKTKMPKILHVSHGLGGGIETHIKELCEYLNHHTDSFSIILIPTQTGEITIRMGAGEHADQINIPCENDFASLTLLLQAIGISLIHFHHVMHVPEGILSLPHKLKVPYRFTVHDYYLICGNPSLTNNSGWYHNPENGEYAREIHSLPEGTDISAWRQKYSVFLKNADLVLYPSEAAYNIMKPFFGVVSSRVVPHLEVNRTINNSTLPFVEKRSYNIGIIGAISKEKGADRLEELANLKKKPKAAQFNFTLMGYAYRPLKKVKTTGQYREAEIGKILQEQEIDILFFPAQCPETYSYTLSIALESGLPIMAPDLGAFTERLKDRKNTYLFKYDEDVKSLFKDLLNFISHLSKNTGLISKEDNMVKCISDNFYSTQYLEGLKPKVGDSFNLADLDIFTIKKNRTSRHKDFFKDFLWELSYKKGLKWTRSEMLSPVRSWVKRRLAN